MAATGNAFIPPLVTRSFPRYNRLGNSEATIGVYVAQGDKIDLVVIGAGPAGIAAALEARETGATVVLVEAGEMGGTGYNWGALALHAMSAAARRAHDIRNAARLGIGSGEPRINFSRLHARIRDVAAQEAPDISTAHLTAMGIEVLHGEPKFVSRNALAVGERTLRAQRFIIATGARPAVPDIPGIGTVDYHTPETIFDLTRRPGHLFVLGGGATGLALAQAHLRLGCQVTLADMLEPLHGEDDEIVEPVLKALADEGLTIMRHTGVVSVSDTGDGLAIAVKSGAAEHTVQATHLLVATGRVPNLENLDLDKAGVTFGPAGVQLDRRLRTANKRIWLAGDVTGLAHSVHAARLQGRRAAGWWPVRAPLVPRVVHTDPAIARVGLTEAEARKRYRTRFEITRAQFSFTSKARTSGETRGHVKLITHVSGRIVGASVVGPCADELVGLFAIAIARGLTPRHFDTLVAPYPAYAQIVSELAGEYRRAHPASSTVKRLVALRRLLPW